MNIFKKMYCRTYQGVFKMMLPVLPYREPEILKTDSEVVKVLENIKNVLLVTDKGIRGLGLTKSLEDTLVNGGFNLFGNNQYYITRNYTSNKSKQKTAKAW